MLTGKAQNSYFVWRGIVKIIPAERFDARKFVNLSIYLPSCVNVLLKSTVLKFTEYETENF